MDIKAPDSQLDDIYYNDSSFSYLMQFVDLHKDDPTHHLCLFLGPYTPEKKEALKKLAGRVKRSVEKVDFENLVFKSESKTEKKLDDFFSRHDGTDSILYFKNGGKLCGVYTGFTHSRVKYATPQERYFLKKVQDFKGIVIVDIDEFTDADKTIRRAAQSIVKFALPDSRFQRFIWHLKNYSLHGFDIKTKRPDAYKATPGPF